MSTLRGSFPHASLNALILTENTFIAVHASATSAAPVEDMLVSGIGHDDLPLDHIDRYFLMRWRRGSAARSCFLRPDCSRTAGRSCRTSRSRSSTWPTWRCPSGNWCEDGGRKLGSSSVDEDSAAADRTVAETVDRRLNELRPAERRAAGTLLADYPSAGLGTVADLAERAGVGLPSGDAVRPGLGYDGFTAVPSALREEPTQRSRGRWDVSAGTSSTDRILSCCFDVPGRFPTWPSSIGSV